MVLLTGKTSMLIDSEEPVMRNWLKIREEKNIEYVLE
jgi:hypothetical protein